MVDHEHKEQASLMQWWTLYSKLSGIPETLFFAIPNGGHRHIAVAKKMKAEGVKAGIPDLFLAVPRGDYAGLFIEMKRAKGGHASPSQIKSMQALQGQGYACKVCHGWEQAREEIEGYLG